MNCFLIEAQSYTLYLTSKSLCQGESTHFQLWSFSDSLKNHKHKYLFFLPVWNAATARKTNTGTINLILTAGLLVVEDFGCHSKLCVVLLSFHGLLYLQSHHMLCMDRRLWYHCPPPTWEDSWVAHHHTDVSLFRPSMPPIVGSSVTWAFIWDVTVSIWLKKIGVLASELKTMFISFWDCKMVISPHTHGLWMMGHNVSQ